MLKLIGKWLIIGALVGSTASSCGSGGGGNRSRERNDVRCSRGFEVANVAPNRRTYNCVGGESGDLQLCGAGYGRTDSARTSYTCSKR